MKVSSIIKKLNKSYSIVIIPNTSDSVKNFTLRSPFMKVLLIMILILSLSTAAFVYSSRDVSVQAEAEEISKEALQQQIQTMSQLIVEQNQTLAQSKNQIQELKASDTATKDKVQQFTKMYSEIANNYISKTSRGYTTKSSNNSVLDLMELSVIIGELNRSFNSDKQLTAELEKTNEKLSKFIDAVPTFVPAKGEITSPFGIRRHPIRKVKIMHNGVDIDAQKGDPIMAAASGIVQFSGYSKGYGYNVIIDHKNGYKTQYGHSSKLLVKEDEYVKKGQTIALVGSTGVSTGPHLHFEIKIDNTVVNPTKYIDFISK